jgi:hypothetical protein
VSTPTWAFLDFIGQQAKAAAESAAYADAVTDLVSEVSPDEELKAGARDISDRAQRLRSEASRLKYLSESTKNVLSGPDWSSKRLETNIRSTTEYVRRLKRLIAQITVLGTNGAIALNTTEANMALIQVQKNQQTIIMQNEHRNLREMEKEQEESKQWSMFSESQRKQRQTAGGVSGTL